MSRPYLFSYKGRAMRGTKHNTLKNLKQREPGLGSTVEQRFLVWLPVTLLDQCLSLCYLVQCGKNQKESFTKGGNDVCE